MYKKSHIKDEKKEESKINRSVKLKKYASVYNSYVRKTEESKRYKSPTRVRKSTSISTYKLESKDLNNRKKILTSTYDSNKSLNSYQKFVKSESKKEKYKHLPGKERLSLIANVWKKSIKKS
jgi:hypothetical protein